jgi:hypothetical protein
VWERERERERKQENMSDALEEGAISTPSPMVGTTYVKFMARKKKNGSIISKKNIDIRCFYVHKKINM